jgi:hypothetical protein
VTRATDLADLRAALPRWLIFHDAYHVCLTARLREDDTVVIRADEPADLRRKAERRERDLDRAKNEAAPDRPPAYIRPYIEAPPPRTGNLPVIERGSPCQ